MKFQGESSMTEDDINCEVDKVRQAISDLIDIGLSERERLF